MLKTEPTIYLPTGQCCELDEPYQAPPGFFDQPFVYVFDADALTDGVDYRRLRITTFSGADFILRRVAGQDRAAESMQLRDVLARLVFNEPFNTAFKDFPVVPEILYPAATDITFDLLNVTRATNSAGSFLSQLAFQGVRRFAGYPRPPSYPYWEDEWKYTINPRIDFGAGETRSYAVDIYDCDFELLRITAVAINPPDGGPSAPPSGVFKMQLFDQVKEQVFMKPLIDDLFIDNATSYAGVVPVPGILYRIGQQLRVEVTSLVTPLVCPVEIQICFHGVRRRPC